MRTHPLSLLLLAALCVIPRSSLAFDKSRDGFVLGLGFGLGQSKQSSSVVSNSGASAFLDFKIGGGVGKKVWIYLVDQCGFYSADISAADWYGMHDVKVSLIQNFGGVGATIFLKPEAPSAFVQVALGMAFLTETPLEQPGEISGAEAGYGFQVGAGFEIIPRLSAQVNYMRSNTRILNDMAGGIEGEDPQISSISVTVNWMFY